ncbi:hypothetical protein KP509_15G039100 [Ceratopteris richardii]|uniref:Uncharacterized protein n=1 Tax=Ceratopteris richardii TaxID=49495 RepID=A0A8T2T6Y2_CERRI|nr:hypothetical protein KP509_15G039100 [Ceratopteris richardii]
MVCSRSISSPSDERSSSPLGSLSLASVQLKPPRPSILSSLMKSSPITFVKETALPMDSSPNSPKMSPTGSHSQHVEVICSSLNVVTPGLITLSGNCAEYTEFAVTASKVSEEAPSFAGVDDVEEVDGKDKAIENSPRLACGRQRLQEYRMQMSGKVVIPDSWGREEQLQDWVTYGIVEDALRPAGLMAARAALVNECQRHPRQVWK